jgi:hypothetical protein
MREHERDRRASAEEPAALAPAVAPPSHAADVLALQRSAGNQAVGRWLARDEAVAEEGGTGTRHTPGDWKITISGIGTFEAQSVNWGGTSEGAKDVSVSSALGTHSSKLQLALINGKPVTVEIVHKSGLRITVKKGHITQYQVSGGGGQETMEYWTVSEPKKKGLAEEAPETEGEAE